MKRITEGLESRDLQCPPSTPKATREVIASFVVVLTIALSLAGLATAIVG